MTIRVNGQTIELADWIEDRVYSTVAMRSAADLHAFEIMRPLPAFGELPGDGERQYQHRWPDILRWYTNTREPVVAHDVLHELRAGSRRMTRMLANTLVIGLRVRVQDHAALIDMIASTHFGEVDSEWALSNLIDAAVERCADENERLAEAWARAAPERRFRVPAGAPL